MRAPAHLRRADRSSPVDRETGATSVPVVDDVLPGWLSRPLAAVIALVTMVGLVGLGAAVAEVFVPAVVLGGAVLLGGPAAVVAVRAVPRARVGWATHASAGLLVAAVAAITLWNGAHHAQHLVADRDPGVYLTTARHLMDEGDVLVPGPVGPFADGHGLYPNGAGFSNIRGDGTLEPQFPHLTAVTVALGGWVDEVGMFLVTPALAGLALLALYAWGSLLVGPRWAALGTVLAGVTMPFTTFARDVYSEPITTVLLFGGLWLLHLAHRSGHRALWLLAGLAVGGTNMARVDSWLYLAPVVLGVVLAVRLRTDGNQRGQLVRAGWFALGLATTSALGFWDTATLTGGYYGASLSPRLPAMLGAAAAAALVAWFAGPLLWRRAPLTAPADGGPPAPGPPSAPQPTLVLRVALGAFALGCTAFFAWGYWVRPDPDGLPPVAVEGIGVLSFLPQAATLSMHWLEWYLGPVGLVAALGGLLWSVVRLGWVRGVDPAVVAGLGAVVVTLLLYLWTPSITPDHPWAMRRFAPVALPGLALGVAAAGRALWALGAPSGARRGAETARAHGRRRRLRHGGAAALASVVAAGAALAVTGTALATTAAITWPTRSVRAQVPMRDRMHEICSAMGDDAAVLVPIDGILALMMSVPVGVWCDVPSAGGTPSLEVEDVARQAVAWAAEGRRLVVLSSSSTPMMNTLLGSGLVARTTALAPVFPKVVEPTISSRPDEVVADGRLGKGPDGEVTFYVYDIDVAAARRLLATGQASEVSPEVAPDAAPEAPSDAVPPAVAEGGAGE